MDMKVKIWDVHNERTCIQTYLGHTKAVRDVSFNFDGTRFVSASYDKYCKLWDTESGKCVAKYEMKGILICLIQLISHSFYAFILNFLQFIIK